MAFRRSMMIAAAAGLIASPLAARPLDKGATGGADHDATCFVALSVVGLVLDQRGDKIPAEERAQMEVLRFGIPFYAARLSARFDDSALKGKLSAARESFKKANQGDVTAACYREYSAAMTRVTKALQSGASKK